MAPLQKLSVNALFLFVPFIHLFAQTDLAKRKNEFNLENGLAIQGFDPVAYFTNNKAIKGSNKIATVYKGVTYHFSSQQNKNLFEQDPEKYEPQYGGWCAYAMGADGSKVKIDPETFKIVNSRLYLFYNFFFNNTLTKWNEDEGGLKEKADQNWNTFINP